MVQLLTVLLILLSFAMTLAVPVACASPAEWEKFKGPVFAGGWAWSALVLFTGFVSFAR